MPFAVFRRRPELGLYDRGRRQRSAGPAAGLGDAEGVQPDGVGDGRRVHDGRPAIRQRQGHQRVPAAVLAGPVRGERGRERRDRLARRSADGHRRRPGPQAVVRHTQRAARELCEIVRGRLPVGRDLGTTTLRQVYEGVFYLFILSLPITESD